MANHHVAHIKIREPRKLECTETLLSLQQWKMQFKQYIKQDDHYKKFLGSNITWDPTLANYGFLPETQGLARSGNEQMDDCKDFLLILATFLPHCYLTEKLVDTATLFEKACCLLNKLSTLNLDSNSFTLLWWRRYLW